MAQYIYTFYLIPRAPEFLLLFRKMSNIYTDIYGTRECRDDLHAVLREKDFIFRVNFTVFIEQSTRQYKNYSLHIDCCKIVAIVIYRRQEFKWTSVYVYKT